MLNLNFPLLEQPLPLEKATFLNGKKEKRSKLKFCYERVA